MNEEFLRIKRIDTDTVVIPETNNKFEYHRLKDLLDEYYEWRVNKLNKSDVISSVCKCKGGAVGRNVTADFEHQICDKCGNIAN